MKYVATARFLSDYARLNERERALFLGTVREINAAYARDTTAWPPQWPASLRLKAVQGAPGIWEITWSFAVPDGRATLQFISVEDEAAVQWRRIGRHDILQDP